MSDTSRAAPDPDDRDRFEEITDQLQDLAALGPDSAGVASTPSVTPGAEPSPDAAPVERGVAAQPAPTPTPSASVATEPDPPLTPVRPEYPLRRLQSVGLAMTVAMAAVGQILFWREFFGGGTAALAGAVAIAAAFEVLMIGATDTALDHKASGSPWWRVLFPVGALAAGVAATVQLLHWPATMGIPFAAAALIGWGAHAISGWIRAQHYQQEKAFYDGEIDRRRRKAESRADAEYERRRAEWDTPRQAAARAADEAAQEPRKPETKPTQGKSARSSTTARLPRPDRSDVVAWARAHNAGHKKAAAHFQRQGYRLPESTARDWLAGT